MNFYRLTCSNIKRDLKQYVIFIFNIQNSLFKTQKEFKYVHSTTLNNFQK